MASKEDGKTVKIPKSTADLQRMKLEKLMRNPTKEVHIPEASKEYKPRDPQEFIRNVWGSSAGAGSGDFHVYRGVRRREYARQKYITEKAAKEEADAVFQKKLEENKKADEDRMSKKRAKRLKKKQRQKNKKPRKEEKKDSEEDESEEEDEDEEDRTKPEVAENATKTLDRNGMTEESGSKGEEDLQSKAESQLETNNGGGSLSSEESENR